MNQISGGQWFCLLLVGLIVIGATGIAWAEAWGNRRRKTTGKTARKDPGEPL